MTTEKGDLTDDRIEELKREYGIDEVVADLSGKPVPVVEKHFDPWLRDVFREYFRDDGDDGDSSTSSS